MTAQYPVDKGPFPHKVAALVALFDADHDASVRAIWQDLEEQCGLTGIQATPFPHFSFHVAEQYQLSGLDEAIEELLPLIPPFGVRTSGLTVFTGAQVVVAVQVVATQRLLELHQILWTRTGHFGKNLNPYYAPGEWVPHITLANRDVSPEKMKCLANLLSSRPLAWDIQVDKLAVVCVQNGESNVYKQYQLRE